MIFMKNKYRLLSGASALLLGLTLVSCRLDIKNPTKDTPNTTQTETIPPEEPQPSESLGISEEEETFYPYQVTVVNFTDPDTGRKRALLMTIEDCWPHSISIEAKKEDMTHFIKAKLGNTELAPYIDETENRAVVLLKRSLSEPNVFLEEQSSYCEKKDIESGECEAQGYYQKDTLSFGTTTIETEEKFASILGDIKLYTKSTTEYDDYGTAHKHEEPIFAVTNLSLVKPDLDLDTLLTREDCLTIEKELNNQYTKTITPNNEK